MPRTPQKQTKLVRWRRAGGAALSRRWTRWHTETTVAGSFAASVLVLGLLGAISWSAATLSIESGKLVRQSHEIIRALYDVQANVYRAFADQRGYLLNTDRELRRDRDWALAQVARGLEKLETASAGDPLHRAALAKLRDLWRERVAHFAAIDRVFEAEGAQRATRAFVLVHPESSVGAIVAEATAAEERRLEERRTREQATVRAMYVAFAIIGLALTAGLMLIFRRIHRELELRERSDASARDAAERLERAMEASRILLWDIDLGARSVYLSQRWDDPGGTLSLPPRLSVTETMALIAPEDHARMVACLRESLAGRCEDCTIEHRVLGPGGDWIWVLSRGRVTARDPATAQPSRISGTSVDITQRKLAEDQVRALNDELERRVEERTNEIASLFDALRDSEQRVNAVIETALDAIIIADGEGRIELFNPAAERMFGYRRSQAVGKSIDELMPERHRAAHRAHIERFRATGSSTRRMGEMGRVAGLRADGTEFPVEASIARAQVGGKTFFTAILRDVTERVRDEEEIRDLHTGLEERVRQRTGELAEAMRQLESFSYSVSHDLRAPVRAMSSFSEIVLEDYGDAIPLEARRMLLRIVDAGARMGEMIDGLLELGHVSRRELVRLETDLSRLAREVWGEVVLGQPGREVAFEVQDDMVDACDPVLARLVLQNLLGNAFKYTRDTPRAQVAFGRFALGGETAYFVRDNGAGFDMAYVGKLFGVFERLHGQGEFEGTGIGLATVKRIVQRHGGRVWAESAPGQGATFLFTLAPAADAVA